MRAHSVRSLLLLLSVGVGCTETKVSDYNTAPTAAISLPADGSVFSSADYVEFSGVVKDQQQDPDTLGLSWTSDRDGLLNADPADSDGLARFTAGGLSIGAHVITLQVLDDKGLVGEDWIGVTVADQDDPPSLIVLHPEEGDVGHEGEDFDFEAYVDDEQDAPEELGFRITSDVDGLFCDAAPLPNGSAGCGAALSTGSHTLLFEVEDSDGNITTASALFEVLSGSDVDDDGDGYTENEGDCDDASSSIYPGAGEFYNGVDDDCDERVDESTPGYDDDGDGYSELEDDCDDADPERHPGAEEVCDAIDQDCDGAIDEGTDCQDDDGDGYTEGDGDCDDSDDDVYPGADEPLDGVDSDCDGDIDEGTDAFDDDGDCYCEAAPCQGSVEPSCKVVEEGDCDDDPKTGPEIHPDGEEVCDGQDNNCDGYIDEDAAADAGIWYADTDYDGYGDPGDVWYSCSMPPGYVPDGTDCDDSTNTVNPGASESCDGADNDCDTAIDEGVLDTFYYDGDSDGYGDASISTDACEAPAGYTDDATDCNDSDAAYNPGAVEDDCTDPNDYNCDGAVGYTDGDGDGFAACEDCDDSDAAVNPDAEEVCDEVDNDCDGSIDPGLTSIFYADSDSDGYGDPADYEEACTAPANHVSDNTDCNDNSAAANPGQAEVCDNIDNNCDGIVDEDDADDAPTWYDDDDGDGYGDPDDTTRACYEPAGYSDVATDCDDGVASTNPGAVEVCDENDNDCDGATDEGVQSTFYADLDSDSFGDPDATIDACSAPSGYVDNDGDCDDSEGGVYPGATETCNGIDDNCNDSVDEDSAVDALSWYYDGDSDGYGDPEHIDIACEQPEGYVSSRSDCDDGDGDIYPGAPEVCDEVDQDCDDSIDEGVTDTFYADSDSDGYGNPSVYVDACSEPFGYTADSTDCNDTTAAANPGEPEVCDGIDNDCNGTVDEDGAVDAATWYYDGDSDGYGDPAITAAACDRPSGFEDNGEDCDDVLAGVNPGAAEVCDEVDQDCDGGIDEGVTETFYADFDEDGYGDAALTVEACEAPSGYTADATDCDDASSASNPGASEVCDGSDNDCDAAVDEDATDDATWYADGDGDGYGNPADTVSSCARPDGYVSNSSDCDDGAPGVYPGAAEVCDEVDQDCDGGIDEGVSSTYYLDDDGDGFGAAASSIEACSPPAGYADNRDDCSDASADINPDAAEVCDSLDNDCDVAVDEDGAVDALTWYYDGDSDGYGSAGSTTVACEQPANYEDNGDDCNDASAGINPGAAETCNGVDDDCDATTDEGVTTTYYADYDSDGYGDAAVTEAACSAPAGFVSDSQDCDDGDAGVYPGASEYCNGVDDDCDASTDESGALDAGTWYADDDSDGYGDPADSTASCEVLTGYVSNGDDCDDGDGGVSPAEPEVCDEVDQDCDGSVDEGVLSTFYYDQDGDGYGSPSSSVTACSAPVDYVANDDDCNDTSAAASPDQVEVCDGLDNNCDGYIDEAEATDAPTWYYDGDSDGYGNAAINTVSCEAPAGYVASSTDCDDSAADVNPGTSEACDGEDDDCDGFVDEEVISVWYVDADSDGYGDASGVLKDCDPPDGYVDNAEDCDDSDGTINPDTVWYQDKDEDGFGTENWTRTRCEQPDGYVIDGGDCADARANVYPGADEYCDGLDNDCDNQTDETGAVDCVDWYYDGDNDGYGDPGVAPSCECAATGQYRADNAEDCYDANDDAHPAQTGWFSVDRGDGSYDYNCDANQERRYTDQYECTLDFGGLSCSDVDGWDGSVPSCGATEQWDYDGCSLLCLTPNAFSRTQTCR